MSGVSKTRVLVLVGGLVLVLGVVVAVLLANKGRGSDGPSGEQVQLEVRAKPIAKLKMNGKSIGTTPKALVVAKGTTPIELEATFIVEKISMGHARVKKIETWRQVKSVVPDASQSVDFKQSEATKVEEHVEGADPHGD